MEFFGHAESWVLVAFLLFVALMIYMKVPGLVARMLDERAAKIAADLAEARKLREEAQALLASYQAKRTEAEKDAASIVAQAKADAAEYAEEARRKLAETLDRRRKQAEQKIAQAEAAAIKEVRAIATDVAVAAATNLVAEAAKGAKGAALTEKLDRFGNSFVLQTGEGGKRKRAQDTDDGSRARRRWESGTQTCHRQRRCGQRSETFAIERTKRSVRTGHANPQVAVAPARPILSGTSDPLDGEWSACPIAR